MEESNDTNKNVFSKILASLENRIILLLTATLFSIFGNQAIIQSNPESVRPDKFTGTMGKELEARILKEMNFRILPLEKHMENSDTKWRIIYTIREDVAVIKQQITTLQKSINETQIK